MRTAWLGVVCLACGCGWISGLDRLAVDDASVDASFSDADTDADASTEADAEGPCDFQSATATRCPEPCKSSCCAASQQLTCLGTGCAGVSLSCTTSDECDGSVCCLEGVTSVDETCPVMMSTGVGAHAACQAPPCQGFKLCINDLVCPSGHCRLAVLGADLDAALGICTDF